MEPYFVDVWSGHLAPGVEKLQALAGIISDSERLKAKSFRQPLMHDRYIAVRGLLRQTLAGYLKCDPAGLQFESNEHGKPHLVGASLHFNISHSANFFLIAVANFPDVGVDIEVIKPRSSLESLARRCFSDREFECWRQLPPAQRLEAFYQLWTKKEAFVKAVGRGIALGLENCEVVLEPDGQLLAIPAEFGPANAWKAIELPVENDACAALVAPNCGFVLRRRQLSCS